jgi:hypothetical protein
VIRLPAIWRPLRHQPSPLEPNLSGRRASCVASGAGDGHGGHGSGEPPAAATGVREEARDHVLEQRSIRPERCSVQAAAFPAARVVRPRAIAVRPESHAHVPTRVPERVSLRDHAGMRLIPPTLIERTGYARAPLSARIRHRPTCGASVAELAQCGRPSCSKLPNIEPELLRTARCVSGRTGRRRQEAVQASACRSNCSRTTCRRSCSRR